MSGPELYHPQFVIKKWEVHRHSHKALRLPSDYKISICWTQVECCRCGRYSTYVNLNFNLALLVPTICLCKQSPKYRITHNNCWHKTYFTSFHTKTHSQQTHFHPHNRSNTKTNMAASVQTLLEYTSVTFYSNFIFHKLMAKSEPEASISLLKL